jgi:hypothetical protein
MPIFEIKTIHVPLFGVVEDADQSMWLSSFSAPTPTTEVHLDASAFDMLAEDLELDAEGLATDAERYVNGDYRPKARGMGGSRLGDDPAQENRCREPGILIALNEVCGSQSLA